MLGRLCLALATVVSLSLPALAQSPGSAFIVNRFAAHSDGNAFVRKDGAYLAAGPGLGCTGAGLVDGIYCFAITDPAATVLLTTDPIAERCVEVKNGVLSNYLGHTRVSTRRGPCGSTMVRLVPFDTTPYPSGEYKLWLTRLADYDPAGSHLFGFDPARSKSDNFRVITGTPQAIVRGYKYFDHDEDAVWNPTLDPLEVPIGGWRVELYKNGLLDGLTYTDQDGRYLFLRDRDGSSYSVREVAPGGFVNDGTPGAVWLATTPREATTLASAELVTGPDFGNVSFELQVSAGQPNVFWISSCEHEDDDDDDDGDCDDEDCNSDCHDDDHDLSGDDDEDDDEDCGHHDDDDCDCGVTGRSLLHDCDPTWRQVLTTRNGSPVSLRRSISSDNPNVSIYAPNPNSSFGSAFKKWVRYSTSHPHDHAGFLLSREVATTLLNNSCGFMQGSIYVDRFQNGVLVSLDEMLTGAIGLLNETGAGLTGPNDPFQDLRQRMLNCTNEFGTINNTADPAEPQIVYRRGSGPTLFFSPY
ncbi:MAG: hypothetical protein IPJ77_21650 [Planctomycetes bacterium]|nr:hypothetical protein [Planctomycetota bacterium]